MLSKNMQKFTITKRYLKKLGKNFDYISRCFELLPHPLSLSLLYMQWRTQDLAGGGGGVGNNYFFKI